MATITFLRDAGLRPGSPSTGQPLFQPVVVGLPARHPPDHFHEHGSDSWISVLAHAASSSLASATGFPRKEPAVAEYLSPIGNP